MRFITFEHKGRVRPGVLLEGDPSAAGMMLVDGDHPDRPEVLQGIAPDMRAWIAAGLVEISLELKRNLPSGSCLLPLSDVRLLAPLPNPGKIVGAAFNYRDGLKKSGRPVPEEPVIFIKSGSTVVGPEAVLRLDPAQAVTYEAELAAIMGGPAIKVSRESAMGLVCGYAIFNDVSYTDLVREDGSFVRGKNQPDTGPFGPWILSADDLPEPHDLSISLDVDGRVLQASNTSQMLFRTDELIEYISARMPLDPGDVIATGTPAGVAANHEPPAWLRPGQTVAARIERLGELRNLIAER